MFLDVAGHPTTEHKGLLDSSGGQELQSVVDHGSITERQQSLTSTTICQLLKVNLNMPNQDIFKENYKTAL